MNCRCPHAMRCRKTSCSLQAQNVGAVGGKCTIWPAIGRPSLSWSHQNGRRLLPEYQTTYLLAQAQFRTVTTNIRLDGVDLIYWRQLAKIIFLYPVSFSSNISAIDKMDSTAGKELM